MLMYELWVCCDHSRQLSFSASDLLFIILLFQKASRAVMLSVLLLDCCAKVNKTHKGNLPVFTYIHFRFPQQPLVYSGIPVYSGYGGFNLTWIQLQNKSTSFIHWFGLYLHVHTFKWTLKKVHRSTISDKNTDLDRIQLVFTVLFDV